MLPNLKLVVNTQQSQDYSTATEYQSNIQNLVPKSSMPIMADKQNSSYLMLALVILAHVAGMVWLVNAKSTLAVTKEPMPPIVVSLVNNPSPEPEVVALVPTPPQPVVKKQPIVKQKQPTPKPVVAEPENKEVIVDTEAPPTLIAPVVEAKPPVVAESPQPKVEPEPVVEPPRFGAAYLHNPPPEYPSTSRRMGEQGRVLLRVLVSIKGDAESVQLESGSGSGRLDQAAMEAVKKWRFIPAKRNNQAISAYVLVPVKFSLENS